jgi:hypothetical protein
MIGEERARLNNCVLRHDTALDVLALRLRGCYEDVKEFLRAGNGEHDETHRRLYFTATALDTVISYLDEHERGEAAT